MPRAELGGLRGDGLPGDRGVLDMLAGAEVERATPGGLLLVAIAVSSSLYAFASAVVARPPLTSAFRRFNSLCVAISEAAFASASIFAFSFAFAFEATLD